MRLSERLCRLVAATVPIAPYVVAAALIAPGPPPRNHELPAAAPFMGAYAGIAGVGIGTATTAQLLSSHVEQAGAAVWQGPPLRMPPFDGEVT
jgi:hypothetical protein